MQAISIDKLLAPSSTVFTLMIRPGFWSMTVKLKRT